MSLSARVSRLLSRADVLILGGRLYRFTAENPVYSGARIGRGTYGRPTIAGPLSLLAIGSYSSIADGVTIFTGDNHRTDWVTTYPFPAMWREANGIPGHPATRGSVSIGSDVWIGRGAMVMSGVAIGHGAVIGAGAVVTHSVRPYEIVAGNPARSVRFRFGDATIAALIRIAWWDWDVSKIRDELPLLLQTNVADFVARHDPELVDSPK